MILARRLLVLCFAATGFLLLHCGPIPGNCGITSGARPTTDAGFLGLLGTSVTVSLNVPTPTNTCEQGVPSRVDVVVKDPSGDVVPSQVSFVPGPATAPAQGVARVTFQPTRPGWYDVNAAFEPGWGRAQLVGYILESAEETTAQSFDLPAGCNALSRTTSGIWFCGDAPIAFDGGVAAPFRQGRARVAGDVVWIYGSDRTGGSSFTVDRYTTADGGFTLTDGVLPTQVSTSSDLLLASENELWALVTGRAPRAYPTLVKFSADGDGKLTQTTVLSTEDAGITSLTPTRLLFKTADAVFIARQLSAPAAGETPDFLACGFDVVNPASNAPSCATYHGNLAGTHQGGVYTFSEKEKTLRFFSPEGRLLLPRTNLIVPGGTARMQAPGAGQDPVQEQTLAPGFSNNLLASQLDLNVLLTPRTEAKEGILLELYQFKGTTPQAANSRFVWGYDATARKLRVYSR